MNNDSGRAPSGQALVASDGAPSGLHPPGFDPSRCVRISREVYDFLMGEGPLEGVWFGDLNSSLPGRYWWRGVLRCAAGWPANPASVGREGRTDEIERSRQEGQANVPDASAIEARSDATGTGAAEGESAASEAGDAPTVPGVRP